MTGEDLRELRSVVANLNYAFDYLEERSELYYRTPSAASKGWLTRAERAVDSVVEHERVVLDGRPDLWDRRRLRPSGSVEESATALTALLDLFPDVDPDVIYDEEEPLSLPDDELTVREETLALACALAGWSLR